MRLVSSGLVKSESSRAKPCRSEAGLGHYSDDVSRSTPKKSLWCTKCDDLRLVPRNLDRCTICNEPLPVENPIPLKTRLEEGRRNSRNSMSWMCLVCDHVFQLRCDWVLVPTKWWLSDVQRKHRRLFEKLPWACDRCGSSTHTVPF